MTNAPHQAPGSLAGLPTRLRNKITCDDPDERLGCWTWTGSFTKPKQRSREYRVTDDSTKFRHRTGYVTNDRGTPMVHAPELGYPTAAQRVVWARFHGIPLADVPRLQRCPDDRCVSPHHAQPLGPVVKPRQFSAALSVMEEAVAEPHTPAHPRPQIPDDPNVQSPRETLWATEPFGGVSLETAEQECGLPRGSITPELWAEYQAWFKDENPELFA